MPRIGKRELLRHFELALQDAGVQLIYRSPPGRHPAEYTVLLRDHRAPRILVYIWNLTHGGGAKRPDHEYRIQVTGISQFQNESGQQTLILGWSEDFEVFAGFDYRRHAGALGASPSLQISREALRAASQRGFAPNLKGNGETAIAFRPDFAAAYVAHLTELHDTGTLPGEANLLDRVSEDPAAVSDAQIEAAVVPARRMAVIETRRALRDAQFRRRVLNAYGNRCAMCGLQLRLLDAAHVLAVDQPGSTDATTNGVALCALHHRAYDRALVAFDEMYDIVVSQRQVAELTALSLAGRLREFEAGLKPSLILPADTRDYPDPALIARANRARGWVG